MSKEVDYDFKTITCECDHCGEEQEVYTTDFREAQTEIKDLGWISRKIDGEWYDFCCEQCYYDFIKENK